MSKLLYEKESYEIRGACFSVWNEFKGAFKEKIIENSLARELKDRSLNVEQQKRIEIFYKDEKVGTYVPDFVINNKVILEIKSKPYLADEDKRQFWQYMKGSEYRLGFLINFGAKKLEMIRKVYDTARK
ncbi:GxxExxY protein [PVC group bacterium]|nr:GxxExxY protein [PVC group bacterium]MCH7590009.1 GxxExxY protein [PVC group bacterium]